MDNEIFATKERQDILDEYGIRYSVDQDLNFVFRSDADEKRAIKILKAALALCCHDLYRGSYLFDYIESVSSLFFVIETIFLLYNKT